MFISLFGWIGVLALGVMFVVAFGIYCRARTLSNGIMTFASNEFHDAATSLLKTPDELPDSIITALEKMNTVAQNSNASGRLLYAMKRSEASTSQNDGIGHELDNMRPELKELFLKAVTGWLNYVSHQNVVNNVRINFAVMRLKSQGLHSAEAEEQVGFKFIMGRPNSAC